MRTITKDGYTVTSIEQDGAYAGEEIGRVFLLRENGFNYWGLGSVKQAQRECKVAQTMTRAKFEAHMQHREE